MNKETIKNLSFLAAFMSMVALAVFLGVKAADVLIRGQHETKPVETDLPRTNTTAQSQPAITEPPKEPLITITNAVYVTIGNAVLMPLLTEQWEVVSKAYPTRTNTITITKP